MITIETKNTFLIPCIIKHVAPQKTQSNIRKIDKYYTNYGMIDHNVETCRKKKKKTTRATPKKKKKKKK